MQLTKQILVCAVVISLGACTNITQTNSPTMGTIAQAETKPISSYENSGYGVSLDKIEKATAYADYKAEDNHVLYILSLTIENHTEVDSDVNTKKEMILKTETNSYHVLPISDGTSSLDIELEDNSINKGKVIFEIPENEKLIEFQYHTAWKDTVTLLL
ncbi:MAG: hypothetical protein M3Q44_05650 [bacterium]|nr:hypothetical protein [bacterium]